MQLQADQEFGELIMIHAHNVAEFRNFLADQRLSERSIRTCGIHLLEGTFGGHASSRGIPSSRCCG